MTLPEPGATVTQAAANTLAQATFSFTMENERGKTAPFPGVQLLAVHGAVKQPDRFQATARAKALFLNTEIQLVGIGGRLWMSNPIQGAKHLRERRVDERFLPLTRPDSVVRLLLKMLDAPTFLRTEPDRQTGEQTVIGGNFDLTRLGAVAPELLGGPLRTDRALPVEIWIDQHQIIRRLRIFGPVVIYDESDVIRSINFFRFGETVSIPDPV